MRRSRVRLGVAFTLLGLCTAPLIARSARIADEVANLKTRAQSNAALAKVAWVDERKLEPLVLLFEKAPGQPPGFEKPLAAAHGSWLAKTRELFAAQYVTPLALARRADRPLDAVLVLADAKAYGDYAKTILEPNTFSSLAHYDRELGATVSFETASAPATPEAKRKSELAQLVRGMLDGYSKSADVRLPFWIADGLGAYFANGAGADPTSLDRRTLDPKSVERLVRMAHDKKLRTYLLPAFEDLIAIAGVKPYRTKIEVMGGTEIPRSMLDEPLRQTLQDLAWSWCFYLQEWNNGAYRARFNAYLKSALAGSSDFEAFRAAFAKVDLKSLEADFYKWLYGLFQAANPKAPVDIKTLEGLGTKLAGGSGGGANFDMSKLALEPGEAAAAHALILFDIRRGELDPALKSLQDLAARAEIGDEKPHVEREVARLQALIRLRNAFLGEFITSGDKFTFDYEGKKVTSKLKSIDGDKLMLDENRQKLASVPLSTIGPLAIARGASKELAAGPDGWARFYAYVIAADDKGMKTLKATTPETTDLRADADQWYPSAYKLGAAAQVLGDLLAKGDPSDRARATDCVAALKTLMLGYGDLELVKRRKVTLKALATLALGQQFEPSLLASLTAGKVEAVPGDRIRLTYEFDKPEEAADFTADHAYFSKFHDQIGVLATPAPRSAVAKGALEIGGAACLRQPWIFAAPITIHYEFGFQGIQGQGQASPVFMLGIVDDHDDDFVACQGFGSLNVRDKNANFYKSDALKEGHPIQEGQIYKIDLALQGDKVTSTVDGTLVKTITGVPRSSGELFLWVHSDPTVLFHKIVIEGAPALDALRKKWMDRELAALTL
jgi:hypothetical protein